MMTTRCNSIWPLAFHPNISSYGCQWLLQFAPFGIFNLAPEVPGQTDLGHPKLDKFFKSHGGAKRWRPWARQLRFWGLLVREGQATREIRSWPLESALMPSRGLKCRPAGPMHMARQPGLRKKFNIVPDNVRYLKFAS